MKTPRQIARTVVTRGGIYFMQFLAVFPLSWIRFAGWLLGWALYVLIAPRRRVVATNLKLCFPEMGGDQRRHLTQQTFIYFAKAWLDRAWLWHAPADKVRSRVTLTGAIEELEGNAPTVIFLPHFVGLDAVWAAVTARVLRVSTTIYTDQSNKLIDRWILRGRQRFGNLRLFRRSDGVKPIVTALREGQPLWLLPDMDFGPEESVFVPFFGIPTATVPSLPRFARLGRAKVFPVLPQMTDTGYEVKVLPHWPGYPSSDIVADAAFMNAQLQAFIATMPAQYYWVHKRFKTRPEGDAGFY